MKSLLKSLVLAVVLVLGACAKDNGGGGGGDVAVVPQANGCPVGQLPTQQGCLPQGSCPVNYGLFNNQCIPVTVANAGNGSCIAGQIPTQYGCVVQGPCQVNQGYYNNTCVPAYGGGNYNGGGGGYYGNGYGGSYNANYYQNRTGYYNSGGYYGNQYQGGGGGYYGNGYGGGGAGVGINAGFYIGGRVAVPGMYYGY